MAWLDEMAQPGRVIYAVLRGAFYDGGGSATTQVAWATSFVKTTAGLLYGRILDIGTIDGGMPEAYAAPPERTSCSLTLDNSDGTLDVYCLGTALADPAEEYQDDSWLNFRGSIYLGIKAPDGTTYEQRVTPTLAVSGTVTTTETTVSIPLSSRDDDLLGFPKRTVTVRQLALSSQGPWPDGSIGLRDGTATTFYQADFDAAAGDDGAGWTQNLDATIPLFVGTNAVPLLRVMPVSASTTTAQIWVLGWSEREPTVTDFDEWQVCLDRAFQPAPLSSPWNTEFAGLAKVKRRVTLNDGTTADLWFLLFVAEDLTESGADELARGQLWLIPPRSASLGMSSGRASDPVSVIRQIVDDLSEQGSAFVDATTFDRAAAALQGLAGCFGGLAGNAPIIETISHICDASAVVLWIGRDGKLRAQAGSAWNAADVTAAGAALPELRSADILGDWKERIPITADERGAAIAELSIEWSSDQQEFWAPQSGSLIDRAPGRADLPKSYKSEGRISGAWVDPRRAALVFAADGARRAFVTRRFSFIAPLWVAAYETGQLFHLTYAHGLGIGTARGYTQRLCRLERTSIDALGDTCAVVLEDLGPIASVKPCVLDTLANWVRFTPSDSAPADSITLTAASTTVTATNWNPVTAGVVAGDHLWCFGAAAAANRRSFRITAVAAGSVTIEFAPPGGTETIACSAAATAAIDHKWLVVKSQETKTNIDRLTLATETTGKFRDGTTRGFQVMGG